MGRENLNWLGEMDNIVARKVTRKDVFNHKKYLF